VPATFDVAALADQVKPLVVNITTTQQVRAGLQRDEGDPFEFFVGPRGPQKRTGLGTGFVIDPAGYVVTNAHVVEDADTVRVKLADDREIDAEVVGRDPKLDLALLKLSDAKGLPAATLGSSEALRVGEHVLAVGNPFGLGHTVTLGIVSAKARAIGAGPYDDFIQTDASINPGNSGGPLFNWRGEVVGINTAIRAGANGIGFAIPVDALKDILPQLRQKGHVERGKLGLMFQPITSDLGKALGINPPRGALVSELVPNGAAARAGIRQGDVIVAVNGTTIQHAEELPRNVARNGPGAKIKVSLLRDKRPMEVTATLDALEEDGTPASAPSRATPPEKRQSAGKLGIQISDAPGSTGARVDEVTGSGAGELSRGDIIIELNGTPIKDVKNLQSALGKASPGSTVLMKIRRGPLTRFAAVPIPTK
jgi:serine protease Do